jgi:hypothetical protein
MKMRKRRNKMDMALIATIAGTGVAVVGTNVALISWLRSDMKSFELEIRGWKEEFRKDMATYRDEVRAEMKDFHGRLCTIEERNRDKSKDKRNS